MSASLALGPRAQVFAALGDPTRLDLVLRLAREGLQSITRLAAGAPITRQALTKHLGTLADVGLVRAQRRGREVLYELDPGPLASLRDYLDAVSAQWDKKLGDLANFLGEGPDESQY